MSKSQKGEMNPLFMKPIPKKVLPNGFYMVRLPVVSGKPIILDVCLVDGIPLYARGRYLGSFCNIPWDRLNMLDGKWESAQITVPEEEDDDKPEEEDDDEPENQQEEAYYNR